MMCRLADQGNVITELNLSEKHCSIHMLIRVQYCHLSSLQRKFIKGINTGNMNSSMTWIPGQCIWCILNMNKIHITFSLSKHNWNLTTWATTTIWWLKTVYCITCLPLLVYNIYPILLKRKKEGMECQCKDLVVLKIRYLVIRKMI